VGVGVGVEWRVARGRNRRRAGSDGDGDAPRGSPGRGVRAVLIIALAVVAVAGGAAGGRSLVRSEALRLRAIRFEGLTRARADELLALSPVRIGDNILSADLEGLERALTRHPWVRSADARRSWPPSLTVKVNERAAAALIELDGLYLVDDQANVFKRAAAGDGLDLPVVTGIGRADFVQRRAEVEPLLWGALALARAWRTSPREAAAPLSEIHVDPGEGTTIYVGDEGTQVRLGQGDLPAKLARSEQVLSALRAEGKKAEVLHLDNRLHPSWVAVRLAGAGR